MTDEQWADEHNEAAAAAVDAHWETWKIEHNAPDALTPSEVSDLLERHETDEADRPLIFQELKADDSGEFDTVQVMQWLGY